MWVSETPQFLGCNNKSQVEYKNKLMTLNELYCILVIWFKLKTQSNI